MNDKNIIYVETNHEAPYVYVPSQAIRNALSVIDPDDDNFNVLSEGGVIVLYDYELKHLFDEIDRVGLEYEIRANNTPNWTYSDRLKMDQGLI